MFEKIDLFLYFFSWILMLIIDEWINSLHGSLFNPKSIKNWIFFYTFFPKKFLIAIDERID